jgi:hypothetical protein
MIKMVVSQSLPSSYIREISPDDSFPPPTADTYEDVWRNQLVGAYNDILASSPKRVRSSGKNIGEGTANAETV